MKGLLCIISFMLISLCVVAQRDIRGQLTDNETGQPIRGATINVKNTQVGTTSDENGNFQLTVPSGANALTVSFSGYAAREISLAANQTDYTIALSKNVQSLDEVVVVAYGQQEKRKLTGSVGKISGRQIENVPLSSVDQILQGKVAGLQSVATSGQPGAAQDIRIRGIGSISASSSPLF